MSKETPKGPFHKWLEVFRIDLNLALTAALSAAAASVIVFAMTLTGYRGRFSPFGNALDLAESSRAAFEAGVLMFFLYFVFVFTYRLLGGKNEFRL